MDKSTAAAHAIRLINQVKEHKELRPSMIKAVCSYFDFMRGKELSQADKLFLHYLANKAGIPQYYDPMLKIGEDIETEIGLQTISNYIHESNLVVGDGIMLHKYQKEILDRYIPEERNRYFLSAATSFGKTFLIYEIVKKMQYANVAFIFPTISLLSENIFKIYTNPEYAWIKENYVIHTLSDVGVIGNRNLLIFTPERYLSFIDKNNSINLDFVFVDEVYKIDNGFIIDEIPQENERDVAYRIALHELLKNTETDALLVGPYIKFPIIRNDVNQSSFGAFLNKYKFVPIDYNKYDVVNKEEIVIKSAQNIRVDDTFQLTFTTRNVTDRFIQLTKQLLDRGENTIVYCSQKHITESKAKELLEGIAGLNNITDDRVIRLINHISNLFADRKGIQWIIPRALKKGIGIHHGLVPKYIQQEIISLFNEGVLKVLICTTTITEGVNTSAQNIIILSGKKGLKNLKKFDAQNIEGRAGRFMHHYKGRVFILNKDFLKSMQEDENILQHKHFERVHEKLDVDILLTESVYLTEEQKMKRERLDSLKQSGIMPRACFEEFKTVSYDDKVHLYNTIARFSVADRNKIKELIKHFVGQNRVYIPGLELICQSIRSIIKNEKLRFLIENGDTQRDNCYLVDMISAFISRGFTGSANFYIRKEQDVDKGIRKASEFVFNILRYQVVKYFGLFNLLYKNLEAMNKIIRVDDVCGIESLLSRLEYGADTQLGRRASDIGASSRVVEYYDFKDKNPNAHIGLREKYNQLDDFEKYNVSKINQILN